MSEIVGDTAVHGSPRRPKNLLPQIDQPRIDCRQLQNSAVVAQGLKSAFPGNFYEVCQLLKLEQKLRPQAYDGSE